MSCLSVQKPYRLSYALIWFSLVLLLLVGQMGLSHWAIPQALHQAKEWQQQPFTSHTIYATSVESPLHLLNQLSVRAALQSSRLDHQQGPSVQRSFPAGSPPVQALLFLMPIALQAEAPFSADEPLPIFPFSSVSEPIILQYSDADLHYWGMRGPPYVDLEVI